MTRIFAYRLLLLLGVCCFAGSAIASDADKAELRTLLDDFLAGAATLDAHKRFWADDLVYTSSSGTRTNKAEILSGMEAAEGAAEAQVESSVVYSADEVDIRVYDDTAVIAFRLVARESGGEGVPLDEYFNTGTFLNRNGEWRAVAWQATRIPKADAMGDAD